MTLLARPIRTQTTRVLCLALTTCLALAATVASAEDGDLARGQKLFDLCTQCHSADGGGDSALLAPAIAGMPVWYIEMQLTNFKNGIRGLHEGDMGGLRMYPMSLWLRDEADQKAVAAYVASLPPTEPAHQLDDHGDATKGAGYYVICSACHGGVAEGNQGMGAPPLTGQSDWYLYSSIKKYRDRVRGSGTGDVYGPAMQGMVATLPDNNAILDVIAHIQSLEP